MLILTFCFNYFSGGIVGYEKSGVVRLMKIKQPQFMFKIPSGAQSYTSFLNCMYICIYIIIMLDFLIIRM